MESVVVIDRRFNGPPDSANGGYAAGVLGQVLPGAVEVTLRTPPPLGTPLRVVVTEGDATLLAPAGDEIVAEARTSALDGVEPPVSPDVDAADRAAARHPGRGLRHTLSDCVVCGPERPDGFRLSTGPLDGAEDVGAAVFRPDASLATAGGVLPAEVLWAALDCPSFTPGMWRAYLGTGALTLLGRLTVLLERPVAVTETLVAVGWDLAEPDGGRKHHTASALLTPSGEVVGRSRATWIRLRSSSRA